MKAKVLQVILLAFSIILCTLLIASCSSTSTPDSGNPPQNEGSFANDGIDDSTNGDTVGLPSESIEFTQVTLNITVPAYSSSSLLVRVAWGEESFAASWLTVESWAVSAILPMNTKEPLVVTFFDHKGDLVLGELETELETGSSATMSYRVTA